MCTGSCLGATHERFVFDQSAGSGGSPPYRLHDPRRVGPRAARHHPHARQVGRAAQGAAQGPDRRALLLPPPGRADVAGCAAEGGGVMDYRPLTPEAPKPRLAYGMEELAEAIGVSRAFVYQERAAGRLKTFK